jgi:uncharacterized damage-inducible protein DinB
MSLVQTSIAELESIEKFFNTSTKELTEDLSTFRPSEGMMTSSQQIAHAAQTVDWFMEGAFRPEGFDMNFEELGKAIDKVTSVAAAREWFKKAIANAKAVIGSKTDADLMAPLAQGPIMGGLPRIAIIGAINDHTAHHRGALTVYARLNGKVPPMPYV